MIRNKILILSAIMAVPPLHAKISLPNYISDNMIVQQNSILTIEGKAAPSSTVKVTTSWNNKTERTESDRNGSFVIRLDTPAAGGAFSMCLEDSDGKTMIENILSGEVWLCSGQSNMEFPTQGWTTVMDYDREVATAYHPDIRLLQVKKNTSLTPCGDISTNGNGWQICSSASMADFSAVAYFFARELSEKLKIPVGVIDATWGGTPAEAWTSYKALKGISGFETELNDLEDSGYDSDKLQKIYQERMSEWLALAVSGNKDFDKSVIHTGNEWKKIKIPGFWEESVLPGFDGVIWLQTTIDIPEGSASLPLTLNFKAIDDEDETYFNGYLVGKGSGYDTPRSYNVPSEYIKDGKNVITIKVSDFGGEGGIAPGKAEASLGSQLISLSGEWSYLIDTDFSQLPPKPTYPGGSSYPSVLYNAMIHPLKNLPLKGILWYQGCANVGRAQQYESLFKALINDWREIWGEKTPFYFVQLAGYLQPQAVQPDSEWAELRNAQAAALDIENTAMAVAIDLGNPADIHPKNKQDVAHRLALIALGRDYSGQVIYKAPECSSAKKEKNTILLTFDSPVAPSSSAITGFIIAGEDGEYTTATATQVNPETIRLYAPGIKNPSFVKYNWADFPCGNLYGATGLPVAPFTKNI